MEENIISKYEPLIYKIARKFYNVELCDLYQAGCIGLIKAYRNYNLSDGTNFINFAYMYIFGEMYDFVNSSKDIKLNKELSKNECYIKSDLLENKRYYLSNTGDNVYEVKLTSATNNPNIIFELSAKSANIDSFTIQTLIDYINEEDS